MERASGRTLRSALARHDGLGWRSGYANGWRWRRESSASTALGVQDAGGAGSLPCRPLPWSRPRGDESPEHGAGTRLERRPHGAGLVQAEGLPLPAPALWSQAGWSVWLPGHITHMVL